MIVDKATVCGHYDDDGRCRSIFVYLNDQYVTTSDVAAAVRAVFTPDGHVDGWNGTTLGDIPRVRVGSEELFGRP